jgi:hypothetical protein
MQELKRQQDVREVEILIEEDAGELTIGAKRQALLEAACGDYVCFVDDDDMVSRTYVRDILEALERQPDATHCSLRGILLQAGFPARIFEHSTKYPKWERIDGCFVRPPNHVNPIRRDLALGVGFESKNWGEDRDFSEKLLRTGCLTVEAWVEPVLYYYRLHHSTVVVKPPVLPAASSTPPSISASNVRSPIKDLTRRQAGRRVVIRNSPRTNRLQ